MDRGVVDTGEPGAEGAPRLLLMRRMSSAAVGEMRRAASPVSGSSGVVSSDEFVASCSGCWASMTLMLPDPAASAGESMFTFSLMPNEEPAPGQIHRAGGSGGVTRFIGPLQLYVDYECSY